MWISARHWVAAALLSAGAARADVSGTVAVVSDDRYRGVSLTDGRPALQASIAFEHPAGPYTGALLSNVRIGTDIIGTRALLYGGFAHQLAGDVVWDLGVATHRLPRSDYRPSYDYTEWYAGAGNGTTSARLFNATDYYGVGARSWYLDANRSMVFGGRYRASAHLGYLVIGRSPYGAYFGVDGSRLDFKAAIGVDVSGLLLEVSLAGTNRSPAQCPLENGHCRTSVVLSVSHQF